MFACVCMCVCRVFTGGVLASPPTLHHVALETVTQDYSATEALLQLVDTFLQRGYAHKVRVGADS